MSYHLGMMFSTSYYGHSKEENDKSSRGDCAGCLKSGWWFNDCLDGPDNVRSNLNGPYGTFKGDIKGGRTCYGEAIVWAAWKGDFVTLKTAEMKIKPYAN